MRHLWQRGKAALARQSRGTPSGVPPSARILAPVGVYGTALSAGFSTAGANIALALVLLATAMSWKAFWDDCRRLRVTWIMAALTVYVIVHSLAFTHIYPVLADNNNPHWSHVTLITGLFSLPIAWWLHHHPRHLPRIVALLAAGLAIGLLRELDFDRLLARGFSDRVAWGKPSGQVGYLAAVGFSGCVVFCVRTWVSAPPLWRRTALAVSCLTLGGGFLTVLFGSQTRGIWFAAAAVVIFYLLFESWQAVRRWRGTVPAAVAVAVIIVMTAAVLEVDRATWERRLKNSGAITSALLDLDRNAIRKADSSLGARVDMWVAAVDAVKERPIFGWGVGSKPLVMAKVQKKIGGTGHFHNLYLELAVGLGLLGFLLFGAVYVMLARGLLQWLRWAPGDPVALTTASALGISLLVALSDVRIGHTASRTVWILMVALMIMYAFQSRQATNPSLALKDISAERGKPPGSPSD